MKEIVTSIELKDAKDGIISIRGGKDASHKAKKDAYIISVKTKKGAFYYPHIVSGKNGVLEPIDVLFAFEQHIIDACCFDIYKDKNSIAEEFGISIKEAENTLSEFKKANDDFNEFFESNITEIASIVEKAKKELNE